MPGLSARTAIVGVACLGLLGVATNIATATLPAVVQRYQWLAWPGLFALLGLAAWVEVRRDGAGRATPALASQRARGVLLDRVHRYWVRGVLEQSLYQEARIDLGLQVTVDAPHPWQVVMAQPGAGPLTVEPVEPGTPMCEVFDELDQTMLILGAPGAGKTTMLLELVRDLVQRARRDDSYPIPLVLTLSSWAARREPLGEWIVGELAARYEIPPAQARAWLDADQLTPLLDGLDEVAAEHRDACADAINTFRAARGTTRIVVCCRSEDYQRLARPLRAYGTLTIQPLRPEQVRGFLDAAGEPVAAVRAALDADPTLWELVESPLHLSIMVLAYRGFPVGTVPTGGSQDEQRERLFATYVRTMLARRPSPAYGARQTARRLAYLARQLSRNNQTVFTFDRLDEYSDPLPSRRVPRTARAVVAGLGIVLLGWLGLTLYGWPGAAVGALIGCLAGLGIVQGIRTWDAQYAQGKPQHPWWLTSGWRLWVSEAVSDGLYATERGGPAFGLAISVGWLAGVLLGRSADWWVVVSYGLGAGVAMFIASWLVGSWAWPMAYRPPRDTRQELPSPRVAAIFRGGLVAALVAAVLAGIGPALLVGLASGVQAGVQYGGFLAVCAGLLVLVSLGGYAAVEQLVLRLVLRWVGLMPLPGRPFLDHATDCLFLRRAGDGYLFAHLSLQEFFDSKWPSWRPWRLVDENLADIV